MPYVAQRKLRMGGLDFARPGNAYDMPHIIPAELVERTPFRALRNLLERAVIRQVEAVDLAAVLPAAKPSAIAAPTDLDSDPRVVKEGKGWYKVDGKRVHGRKGVKRALTELGG